MATFGKILLLELERRDGLVASQCGGIDGKIHSFVCRKHQLRDARVQVQSLACKKEKKFNQ